MERNEERTIEPMLDNGWGKMARLATSRHLDRGTGTDGKTNYENPNHSSGPRPSAFHGPCLIGNVGRRSCTKPMPTGSEHVDAIARSGSGVRRGAIDRRRACAPTTALADEPSSCGSARRAVVHHLHSA